MDTQTRDRLINAERHRLSGLPNWEISHRLTVLSRRIQAYTAIEREALLIEASKRVWSS